MRGAVIGMMLTGVLLGACQDAGSTREPLANDAPVLGPASVLAASCSGCHAVSSGAIVDLSNYTEAQLLVSLNGYREDPGGSSVMHRLARGYSEAEIAAIAAYLGADSE